MTTDNEKNDDTEKAIESGDLGRLLEEYRTSAHLDVNQIADTLCLTPSAIIALEGEAFDKLPEPPYVRGYLRNYARIADKDPQHIIQVYESLRGISSAESNHSIISVSTANSYHEVAKPLITPQRFRLALLAGLLLLLGLLTMIPGVKDWSSNLWSSFSNSSDSTLTEEDAKAEGSLNLPSLTGDVPGNLPISTEETDTNAEDNTNSEDEASSEPESKPATSEEESSTEQENISQAADADTTNAESTAETQTPESEKTTEENATDIKEPPSDQEEETATEGNTKLKLIFSEEVWLRITGEDGKKLYEALHPAGTEKELSLNSPLKFKVGNAPAMKIFVNGKEMDTTEHTKGSVARFGIE